MCELACVNSYHWRLNTTRLVSRVVGEPVTSSGRTALQVLKALQILIYLDTAPTLSPTTSAPTTSEPTTITTISVPTSGSTPTLLNSSRVSQVDRGN